MEPTDRQRRPHLPDRATRRELAACARQGGPRPPKTSTCSGWRAVRGRPWLDVMAEATEVAVEVGAVQFVIDTLGSSPGCGASRRTMPARRWRPWSRSKRRRRTASAFWSYATSGRVAAWCGSRLVVSAFAGAVDIVLSLRRPEGNHPPALRRIDALSRFDETPETVMVELVDGVYVDRGTEADLQLRRARQAVCELLESDPGRADLRRHQGGSGRRIPDLRQTGHRRAHGRRLGQPLRCRPTHGPDVSFSMTVQGNGFRRKRNPWDLGVPSTSDTPASDSVSVGTSTPGPTETEGTGIVESPDLTRVAESTFARSWHEAKRTTAQWRTQPGRSRDAIRAEPQARLPVGAHLRRSSHRSSTRRPRARPPRSRSGPRRHRGPSGRSCGSSRCRRGTPR